MLLGSACSAAEARAHQGTAPVAPQAALTPAQAPPWRCVGLFPSPGHSAVPAWHSLAGARHVGPSGARAGQVELFPDTLAGTCTSLGGLSGIPVHGMRPNEHLGAAAASRPRPPALPLLFSMALLPSRSR